LIQRNAFSRSNLPSDRTGRPRFTYCEMRPLVALSQSFGVYGALSMRAA